MKWNKLKLWEEAHSVECVFGGILEDAHWYITILYYWGDWLIMVFNLTHLERESLNREIVFIKLAYKHTGGAYSWLLIDMRGSGSLCVILILSLDFIQKIVEGELGSKSIGSVLPRSPLQFLPSSSCFVFLPCLLNGGL